MGQVGLHTLARRPAVRRRPRDPPHTASPSSRPNVRHSSSPTQPELVSQAGNGHPAKAHVSRRRTPCERTADSKGRQPKDGHRIAGTLCKEPNRTRQGEAPQLEGKPYVRRRLPRLSLPGRADSTRKQPGLCPYLGWQNLASHPRHRRSRTNFVLVVIDRGIMLCILVTDGRIAEHPCHDDCSSNSPKPLSQVLGALHSLHRTM